MTQLSLRGVAWCPLPVTAVENGKILRQELTTSPLDTGIVCVVEVAEEGR
jgi:hypothetical protein